MVKTLYFFCVPAASFVQHFQMTNVIIQHVTRSGLTYKDGTTDLVSTPDQMKFTYNSAAGTITFLQPFNGPTGTGRIDRTALEKVSVKFKIP